ncbi:hypothetical protein [Streptomyces sp. CAU 1734]|uniref:hypothetical protein n=1 Tax=Streptomyces sp. CAU 1734 TaxID=3140360 RepID=UPI0032618421
MNPSAGRSARIAAAAALTLFLPLAGAAPAAASSGSTSSKPDGPIESSLAVAGTGAIAAASTVMIVRRHERRSRNSRR